MREYLVDLNATQAAIRAGYSAKTAGITGSKLLKNAKVRRAVDEASAKRAERTEIDADRVLLELARIAFGDHRKLFTDDGELKPIHELDDDTAATLASVELVTAEKGEGVVEHVAKVKQADKLRALELLGKHLRMFTDRLEVDASDGLADALARARRRARGAGGGGDGEG